jgi:hypothetical protein
MIKFIFRIALCIILLALFLVPIMPVEQAQASFQEILRPNGTGDSTTFIPYPNTGEANWEDVDEVVADDSLTYTRGYFQSVPIISLAIKENGAINLIQKTITNTFTLYSYQWNTRPSDNNSWSVTDLETLQVGVKGVNIWETIFDLYNLSASGLAPDSFIDSVTLYVRMKKNIYQEVQVTQVYVEVNSIPASPMTFYPDSNPESTSVDGVVLRLSLHGESWSTLVSSAGNYNSDAYHNDGIVSIISDNDTDNWESLSRAIILVDTSGLPDTAVITGGTLSVWGEVKNDTLNIAPDINIYASSPISNTDLVDADYQNLGTVAFSTPIAYANWSVSGYNNFTLNAAGLAQISKVGVSKFGVRNANYDVASITPAWSHSGNYMSELNFYTAEQPGNSQDPKLVVTYALPPSVTTQEATVTSNTTATGNGNITDTSGLNVDLRGFEWDINSGVPYSNNATDSGNFTTGAFTKALTGLPAGTLIYYRAIAHNSAAWGYGPELAFTTFGLPTVTTQAATGISENASTLNGNINSLGGDLSCSERGFVMATSTHSDPGNVAPASSGYITIITENDIYGVGAFDSDQNNLIGSTPYFYRAYTENSYGYDYGSEITFTTTQGTLRLHIEWQYGTTFTDLSGKGNDATPSFRTTSSDVDVSAVLSAFYPMSEPKAPTYAVGIGPDFISENITISGNFTTGNTSVTYPGEGILRSITKATGTPYQIPSTFIATFLILLASMGASYFLKQYSSPSMFVKSTVNTFGYGIAVALKVFDWWMLIFFFIFEIAFWFAAAERRQ